MEFLSKIDISKKKISEIDLYSISSLIMHSNSKIRQKICFLFEAIAQSSPSHALNLLTILLYHVHRFIL